MDYNITNRDDGVRVSIIGQFTFADNQKFKSIIDILQRQNARFIEINFKETTFIDSAALGMLLLLRDQCQNQHIPISIHGVQGQVEKVLLISKFDQLFQIQP